MCIFVSTLHYGEVYVLFHSEVIYYSTAYHIIPLLDMIRSCRRMNERKGRHGEEESEELFVTLNERYCREDNSEEERNVSNSIQKCATCYSL